MLDTDAAWAAGFIDGEGYLGIVYNTRGEFYAVLTVSNVAYEPIARLKELFGGDVRAITPKSARAMPNWRYKAASDRLEEILTRIRPYLLVKGDQADALLEFRKLVTNKANKYVGISSEGLDARAALYTKIRILNARHRFTEQGA